MNQPLVSVNLTTYNRANLLPRCIKSIISQTYDNIEIIIVDDCSQDNTEEVVVRYQEIDNRIKYYRHKKNRGNAAARNTALDQSNGIYIAFMDDDDEWIDTKKLEKQITFFENSSENIGIICSGVRIIKEDGSYKNKRVERPKNLERHILAKNGIIYSPTVMTKKKILQQAGGFDINLPRGIDSDFYRNCIVNYNYKVHFLADITTAVYEHGNNRITPQNTKKSLKKSLQSHYLALRKYNLKFLRYPVSLFERIFSLMKVGLKLIIKFNK